MAGEVALVEGEVPDQVLAEGAGGPLAKAHGASGVDPVAEGDDGIQVVVRWGSPDLTPAFGLNYRGFLGSWISRPQPGETSLVRITAADKRSRGVRIAYWPDQAWAAT